MRKEIEHAALAFTFVVLFLASLYVVRPFLDALIIAAFFAYILSPLTYRVEKLVKSRSMAAVLMVILAILPIVLVGYQVVTLFLTEFSNLSEVKLSVPYAALAGIDLNAIYTSFLNEVMQWISIERVLRGMELGIEIFIKAFIVIAGSFYMLRERMALKEFLVSLAPESKEYVVSRFISTVDKIFHGVFFGHLLTSFFVGVIAGFGFYAMGYFMGVDALQSYPILLGALITITTLLPIIGAWLVYVPMSVLLFLTGRVYEAGAVFLFGVAVLSIAADIVIRPYISGKAGQTHPFIVLLGFMCGPIAFGAIGLILGPAILSLFKATLDTYKEIVLRKQKNT